MPAQRVEPSTSLTSFNCPHCWALAHQTWYDVYPKEAATGPFRYDPLKYQVVINKVGRNFEAIQRLTTNMQAIMRGAVVFDDQQPANLAHIPLVANLSISQCYSCKELSIWVHDKVVDPPVANTQFEPNADLSDDIKRDFKEAASILNISARGSAALLRLCVQKICIQLGESGKNLNDDIGNLVKTRRLDAHVQQALDIVRVVGNSAVHPGQLDLRDNRDTAVKLFGLVNEIAEELITRPQRLDKLYKDIVPEADRKKIAKRDGT